MTEEETLLPVTQEDRDAAADTVKGLDWWLNPAIRRSAEAMLTEDFARHRLATRATAWNTRAPITPSVDKLGRDSMRHWLSSVLTDSQRKALIQRAWGTACAEQARGHGVQIDACERILSQYAEQYPSGCPKFRDRDRAEAEAQFDADTALWTPAQVGRNPAGPGREAGSVRKHEHAVPEGDAPKTSDHSPSPSCQPQGVCK